MIIDDINYTDNGEPVSDEQLRDARAWAVARPNMLSSHVIIGAIDALLEVRERSRVAKALDESVSEVTKKLCHEHEIKEVPRYGVPGTIWDKEHCPYCKIERLQREVAQALADARTMRAAWNAACHDLSERAGHEPRALYRELVAARVILEQIEAHCVNSRGLTGIDHTDDGRKLRAGLQAFLATPSCAAFRPPASRDGLIELASALIGAGFPHTCETQKGPLHCDACEAQNVWEDALQGLPAEEARARLERHENLGKLPIVARASLPPICDQSVPVDASASGEQA